MLVLLPAALGAVDWAEGVLGWLLLRGMLFVFRRRSAGVMLAESRAVRQPKLVYYRRGRRVVAPRDGCEMSFVGKRVGELSNVGRVVATKAWESLEIGMFEVRLQ